MRKMLSGAAGRVLEQAERLLPKAMRDEDGCVCILNDLPIP
jgi:hypothetical protein